MSLLRVKKWPSKMTSFIAAFSFLVFVIVSGTVAYMEVEEWGVFESLYQTLIVISTLGIRQVKEMSRAGEIVTLMLIIGGVGAFTFFFSAMATLLVEGQLRSILGRRKLDKKFANLKGHYIICGYGRMGQLVAKNLVRKGRSIVVVDKDPEATARAESEGLDYVLGDAHEESVLESAGVERARGILSVLPTDADNVFVTLTVRGLSDSITILTQALDPHSEAKLRKAGADRVYNLHAIGANRITAMLIHPTLVEFLDGTSESVDIEVQEVEIKEGSPVIGLSLRNSNLREKAGVQAIAIKRKDGRTLFTPSPDLTISEGDILVCVGGKDSTTRLAQWVSPE